MQEVRVGQRKEDLFSVGDYYLNCDEVTKSFGLFLKYVVSRNTEVDFLGFCIRRQYYYPDSGFRFKLERIPESG